MSSSRTRRPRRAATLSLPSTRSSLDVERGDVYGIIGYSGAGKSTLVRLVNAPRTGNVRQHCRRRHARSPASASASLRAVRRDIGMIFQQFNLFNSKTVARNVAYPLEVAGRPAAEVTARVAEMLALRRAEPTRRKVTPTSCPAARNSGSASRGHSPPRPPSCSPTRRPARSTPRPRARSSPSSTGSTASSVSPSS